jgi:thiamine-monophosphate kinase
MKVAEMGEFALIELLRQTLTPSAAAAGQDRLILGIGDDAAAWRGDASIQMATVDCLVQDVHFTTADATWPEIGEKAIAVNLSDIAAMGGLPQYALVALTLPGDMAAEDVVALYRGMLRQTERFGVTIIGGNISRAPLVSITVTVIGHSGSPERPILTRSAASIGDAIAVTGYPGTAAAGLAILKEKPRLPPETSDLLRRAFLTPSPRITEGRLLVNLGVRTAIDISDGLLADLGHICQASRVGACLHLSHLPIHEEIIAAFGPRALDFALWGGEDYELLFTGPPSLLARARKESDYPITIIGEVTGAAAGEIILLDEKGHVVTPRQKGWDHFAPA